MNYAYVLPEVIICIAALAISLLSLSIKHGEKKIIGYLSLGSLIASLLALMPLLNIRAVLFGGFMVIDQFAVFFKIIFVAVSMLVVAASLDFVKSERNRGEYYSLLLLATLGMMLVASSGDLIMLYVGIELASISTYALVGFKKGDAKSIEAAVKYFVPSAFFTGVILFGISLLYGITGTTDMEYAARALSFHLVSGTSPIALAAAAFLIAGFGFKMAAVPFQMWVADTYEGAPTTISAFLVAGSKNMAFAALFKILLVLMIALKVEWGAVIAAVSLATMTFGNVVALAQKNVKRMLAYSSIAQAGYILVGLAIASKLGYVGQFGLAASMLHIGVYAFMKAGAFIAAAAVAYSLMGEKVDDYTGLSKRMPVTAFCMMSFLVSLTGIVPFGGFASKLFILVAAVKAGGWMFWLAAALLANSALSAYYYGRLVKNMYFMPAKEVKRVEEPITFLIPMLIALAVLLAIGMYPMPFFEYAMSAAGGLIP